MNQVSEEAIKKCREYYINNDVSLKDVAVNSQEICGIEFSVDTIKWFSRQERWPILRAHQGKSIDQVTAAEKLTKVADKLYGLLIDEEDPLPAREVASVAKTWLEINIKANLKDNISTAKVTSQQAKDIIAQLDAENK